MKALIASLQTFWKRLQRIPWIRFLLEVSGRFGKNNGGLMAAGLTFFMLLAFVPMLLVGVAVLGFYFKAIGSSHNAIDQIQTLLKTQVLPGAASDEVKYFITKTNLMQTVRKITETRNIASLVGLGGFVWASMQIFINGTAPVNAALNAPETRSWVKLRLVALALLLGTGALLVLSVAATAYGTILSNKLGKALPGFAVLYNVGSELVAVAVGAVMFALTYRFLPARHASWKAVFVGGTTAAVLWEIAKKGLSVYLAHSNFSLYGNLASLFIFILWVYYSMMILLLGAEVTGAYADDVEGKAYARLKRHALANPAQDTASGSPLSRAKGRDRSRRIRRTERASKPVGDKLR